MHPPDTTPTTAFDLDERPLVAFDWSAKAVHATFDGVTVDQYDTIAALVGDLEQSHKVVAEATFESWDPDARQEAVSSLRAAGHELYVFRPKYTARHRNKIEGTKSDANDALVIWELAQNTDLHIHPATTKQQWRTMVRNWVNRRYDLLRKTDGKKQLADRAKQILGPYRDLDEETALVVGSSGYSMTTPAVVFYASQYAATRDEFEWLLGLYGNAYPSLLRSDVYTHSYRHALDRGVDKTTYRRVLRRMYRTIRNHLEAVGQTKQLPDEAELRREAAVDALAACGVDEATARQAVEDATT